MTLYEMKKKYLSLIEELNPASEQLTDDPDIAAKQNEVVNQVMFELCRMKKIAKYTEIPVKKGQLMEFADIEKKVGNEVFQIEKVCGVNFLFKANGTLLKFLEDGVAEIDCFVFPERITEKTKDKAYEFELSPDVLEIMPYGVAAAILMSDVSANYGQVYAEQYERMLQRLDSRNQLGSVFLDGGVYI